MQMKFMRLPKPKVKIGQELPEHYRLTRRDARSASSLGLLSAAVFGVAAVVQARAVRGFDVGARRARGLRRPLGPRPAGPWLVVAAYLVGFVLHAAAIWLLPLYLAQALVAMSLPVTALASHRVEDAPRAGAAGSRSAWSPLGLVLLSLGAGEPGRRRHDRRRSSVVLWVGVAALALASLAGRAPARAAARPAGRARVRRLGDLRPRRRDAGRRGRRGRRARRAVVQPGRVLALLARHAPRRGARRRPPR